MVQNPDGWPRLDEDIVAAMPRHEQQIIRQHEAETIAASKLQLADICTNCHNRAQFGKTYRVLQRDLQDTLHKVRINLGKLRQPHSDVFTAGLLDSTDRIVSYKLNLMAQHFSARWGEPIESWAEKNSSGCSVVLVVAGAFLTSAACGLLVLLR
jgi:hypothetical protein